MVDCIPAPRPKKRLFLSLILISWLLLATAIYFVWHIALPGLSSINLYLPFILGVTVATALLGIAFFISCMVLAVIGIPTFKIFQGLAWSCINFLLPIAVFLGKLFNIEKERIDRSFIELSNHLVVQKQIKAPADKILLLLPHCLQLDTCPHKITLNANNCRQCGGCSIGGLLSICQKYGIHMAVVPGGTLARMVVKSLRPKVILAVACERDLTSGIQDVFPLPVFGVLNARPCGPCFNTTVDLAAVENAVRNLVAEGADSGQK